jgi:predicted DsbA family dithiol-disulfide isomerase
VSVIEVFADVACPFTHVGLIRFVERRTQLDRDDVKLRVRAWPLEIVNGQPLDPEATAAKVAEIRQQVAPDLFRGFRSATFPRTSLPALALTAAAYRSDLDLGEAVALHLRQLLFEAGLDIADPSVLEGVAVRYGIDGVSGAAAVLADHADGVRQGVVGSPHFFTPSGDFFCPSLDVSHDESGELQLRFDRDSFEAFMAVCFA